MPRYEFGPFLLEPEARLLRREGEALPLAGKTFDLLLALVERRGRLAGKDELLELVWAGVVVEEANLQQAIFSLRKILGDSPKDPHYIATVAGRGYQFVAPVSELTEGAPARPARHGMPALLVAAVVVVIAGAIWLLRTRTVKAPAELVERRLTFNSSARPVLSAAISPDGGYLAYSDSDGIHLRLIATGEERPIPTPAGIPAGTSYVDSWFPSGTELLAHSTDDAGRHLLWAVSVMGGAARELRSDASGWGVSPDGRYIGFFPKRAASTGPELWVMDSRGENARKVAGFSAGEFVWSVRWSPDSQRLVYVRMPQTGQWMETCDLQGGNRIVTVVAEVRAMIWLPGSRIVYSQGEAHDLDSNLWEIDVDPRTGAARDKPRRLTRWSGADLQSMSASADGKRIVLHKDTSPAQVYIGELQAPGIPKGAPRRLIHDEATAWATAWTADSQAVLFTSDRGGKWGVFKQALDGSTAEPLTEGRPRLELVRLSADRAWALYAEVSGTVLGHFPVRHRLMRVPVNGGLPKLVLDTAPGWWQDHECASSGSSLCVVVEASPDEKMVTVSEFDPVGGRGRLLRTMGKAVGESYGYSLSPDGSMLAVVKGREPGIRIRLLSLTHGPDREISVKEWPNAESIQWSPDGKGLYCSSTASHGGVLLYVDLKGNAQQMWRSQEVDGGPFIAGIPSPDGRHIALTGAIRQSSAWMVEGL